jgi:hypothetical protein
MMAVTKKQVLVQLDREEPNYEQARQFGQEALPHLMQIIEEGDAGLAAKATYLAGFINSEQSASVIHKAAQSEDAAVRVAAAASMQNLTAVSAELASRLLDDTDSGVRKWTLRSLATQQRQIPIALRAKLQGVAERETDPILKQLANQVVDQLR